jgi:hypothetical protein
MNEKDFIVEYKQDYKKSWESAVSKIFDLEKENKQLKDRINKAIEYIENKIESDLIPQDISYENGEETEHNYYVNANDLLNLLKEDNKEK